jgi:glycine dehydrogenase
VIVVEVEDGRVDMKDFR